MFRLSCALLPGLLMSMAQAADDPFSQHVRPTEALSPRHEQAALHVPPGFKLQLFASEPMINKPINMAFDARGQLWVSSTVEYPHPVAPGKPGRDSIKVLEDSTGDGQADKVTTFVDGLNIPTGVVPYKSGCIAWSIPNIWFFDDTNGDGRCDKRTKLYGPFGWERDTHGMNSSFRMGMDGWVYATHGFNNESKVAGLDGHQIIMQSGHTYRFKPDGSRIEIHTRGQVNPFGMCFDPRGNLYSADCHSTPITQLLRGAYYSSFGKPHDGLGFGPGMMQHTHDSTGLCGLVYLDDEAWPAEFRDNMLIGDVLSCRVKRDRITFTGSTPKATKQADFVTSDDPWFRPVDLQFGPDGALYIADFYNRIIGHYEVPLDHPGRDRERGRIWRVVADGNARTLADQRGAEPSPPSLPEQLWSEHRSGALNAARLVAAIGDRDARVRIHALRMVAESTSPGDPVIEAARSALADPDAHVQRAAAFALGAHPSAKGAPALASALAACPAADTHLRHVLRMALRDQLVHPGAAKALRGLSLPPDQLAPLVDFAAKSGTPAGAVFVLDHLLQARGVHADSLLPQIAAQIPQDRQLHAAALARDRLAHLPLAQLATLTAMWQAEQKPELREWALALGKRLLSGEDRGWKVLPHPDRPPGDSPFFRQQRQSADGVEADFICSLPPGGESLTGVLRSPVFATPAKLSFYLAGHDGYPGKALGGHNFLAIRGAESGELFAKVPAPRNDTAQGVELDLSAHRGKPAVVELVDGDTAAAYAWIAAGRFDLPVLGIPDLQPGSPANDPVTGAAHLAQKFALQELAPGLRGALGGDSRSAQNSIAEALGSLSGDPALREATLLLKQPLGEELRQRIIAALEKPDQHLAGEVFAAAGPAIRSTYAQGLAGSVKGARLLVNYAPPTELMAPAVKAALEALDDEPLKRDIARATKGVSAHDALDDVQIMARLKHFGQSTPDRAWGSRVFTRYCAVCHQHAGAGTVLGPQLDGVHSRGAARLVEDILAPNRHVDPNFRIQVVKLKDKTTLTGMRRGEDEAQLTLIDAAGVLHRIPKIRIEEIKEAAISLMPTGLGAQIGNGDFSALLAYLLQGPR